MSTKKFLKDCPACKRRYKLTATTLLARDKDSINCSCGEILLSWNGAVSYSASQVSSEPKRKGCCRG